MKFLNQKIIFCLLILPLYIPSILSQRIRKQNFEKFKIAEKNQRELQDVTEIQNAQRQLYQYFFDRVQEIENIILFATAPTVVSTEYQQVIVTAAVSIISVAISAASPLSIASAISSTFNSYLQAEMDKATAQSLYDLQEQVDKLSDVVWKLRALTTQQLNLLDQSLSYQTIDQEIYLLQSFLFLHKQFKNSTQTIQYKQLCGKSLHMCNQAFLKAASGLKDFFRTVRESSNWDRITLSNQYIVYSSLLLNSMNALTEVNLRIAKQEYNITDGQITLEQSRRYSQLHLFNNSLVELGKSFDDINNSTYTTKKQSITVNLNSLIDLVLNPSYLLISILNIDSGDKITSLTQTIVANRNDTIRNLMEIDFLLQFDNDNTWFYCPYNSFLTSYYLSDDGEISNLESFRCSSYENYFYQDCQIIQKTDQLSCPNGYFISGLFREIGNNLPSLTKLQCCSLTNVPPLQIVDAYNTTSLNITLNIGQEIDFTNKTYFPVSLLQFENQYLIGQLKTVYKNNSTQVQETILQSTAEQVKFNCPIDHFLTGIYLKDQTLTGIENLSCTKYANVIWNQCFEQIVLQYESYKVCTQTNTCDSYILKCEIGYYLAGLIRSDPNINTSYGIDRIFCCSQTSPPVI